MPQIFWVVVPCNVVVG